MLAQLQSSGPKTMVDATPFHMPTERGGAIGRTVAP
jgi:hypothetical protein